MKDLTQSRKKNSGLTALLFLLKRELEREIAYCDAEMKKLERSPLPVLNSSVN
jgi:hypothetical protein